MDTTQEVKKILTVKQFLIKVRGLIKKGWMKGFSSAKDKNGTGIDWYDPSAVKFCLQGAFWKINNGYYSEGQTAYKADKLLLGIIKDKNPRKARLCLPQYNEGKGRTKKQVLSVLSKAIELA